MSLAFLFHYFMLNMFRMLIHPSSGACDLFVELFHGLYCSTTKRVGVTLWFGWGGVVFGCSILTFTWPCIVINSYNKTKLDALISQIYFWNKTLHASDSSSLHHQEFFTVHTAMVNVIQVCWQQLQFRPDPARCQAVSKPVWHIPLLCVQWKLLMMDRGTVRNM